MENVLKSLMHFMEVFHRTVSLLKNFAQLFEKPSNTCEYYVDMKVFWD